MMSDRSNQIKLRHGRVVLVASCLAVFVGAMVVVFVLSAPRLAEAEGSSRAAPSYRIEAVDATGSECLVGGSATASGCVVTTQQPVLQIPGTGNGNVYIVDGSSPDQNNAWVSPQITLSPSSSCGGNTCFPVPADAGLLPRQSYQWAFVPSNGGGNNLSWQGFTIDYVRAGKEPADSFGPLSIGLASGTVRIAVQSQAVQTASGMVQVGLSHRGLYNGTPTGKPWFVEDPAGALPVGWVFSGVDANVPWVRVSAVDGVGGSGTQAVTLVAFDGSLLEFTNTNGGSGGWAPPVGVGRPANDYGSLSQSIDGTTFTWTSGTTIVSFVQSENDPTVWLAHSSQQVLPGSNNISPGLQVTWDTSGRLATIADQSSLDGSGKATRTAHFYYGGDSQCGSPSGSGLVAAPTGMLCAFENLDGSLAQVFYRALKTTFGEYQIGQVVLPGSATWSFEWQAASFTLSNNTTVTAPQLLSVQTPSGYDATNAGTVTADESKWWVVYDPFFGELEGFVSPLPGAGPAGNDRIGRTYTLASGTNPGQAEIAWANVNGSAGNFSLGKGAVLQTIGFDTAWRRTSVETFLNDTLSYTTAYTWDANLDLQTGISFAGASQSQSYDFLGRPATLTGPGQATSTASYDQDNLSGWIATVYPNSDFVAPGVGSEAINRALLNLSSAPNGVTSNTWSMQLSTYLAAPADGDNVVYRLSSDSNSSATLWVNGQCNPVGTLVQGPPPQAGGVDHTGKPDNSGKPNHTGPPGHTGAPDHAGPGVGAVGDCGSDNTATTSSATNTGDALNLVVQYVRNGAAVSASAPVTIQVEQQINGGNWTALTLADLDPGFDLQSTVATSDTLAEGAGAVTLTRTTAWNDALFRTRSGVTNPGFNGDLTTIPGYEASYDPTNSEWKRLISQTSAGNSTYGFGYWNNTGTPNNPACSNTNGVIQAGQVQVLTYPESSSGAAAGLSRRLVYDAAGRRAGLEIIPAGDLSGVLGCLSYDARGRKLKGQVNAYSNGTTGGGAMSKSWTYSPDGFTVTITHTFENPLEAPACASETTPPYTCIETRTVDLLGRTVATQDVWGTTIDNDYQLDAGTGVLTTMTIATRGSFTTTATLIGNRDGSPASLIRSDTAGSPTLSATWTHDVFGRAHSLEIQSDGNEVITASYGYDSQNRVDSMTWSRSGSPVVANDLSLSPNSTRTLGESISINGVTYRYAYTFNNAGWLTEAALSSSDNSLTANWDYTFGSSGLGSNGKAYLNGNVTSYTATVSSNSQNLDLGYDFLDRVEATSSNTPIAHDALGNLTQYGGLQLIYDQTNQVVQASDGTTMITFNRTPDGDLYRKTTSVNGTDTSIRYASGGLILNDAGVPTHQTLLIGTLLATLDLGNPNATDYTVTTLQYGNALLKLDSSGAPQNLAAPILYNPWGQAINAPVSDPAHPTYGWQATNLLETNLDMVLMGERIYLTDLGRFTSLDPAFRGGVNPYNYATNDPVNNDDPNGTVSTAVFVLGGGGGIAGLGGTLTYFAKACQCATSFTSQRLLAGRNAGGGENNNGMGGENPNDIDIPGDEGAANPGAEDLANPVAEIFENPAEDILNPAPEGVPDLALDPGGEAAAAIDGIEGGVVDTIGGDAAIEVVEETALVL